MSRTLLWSAVVAISLLAAGGVAANVLLRCRLATLADTAGLRFVAPPPAFCTDNAAMIAWAGLERFRLGLVDGLDAPPRPRWPLDRTAIQRARGRRQEAGLTSSAR